MSVTPLPRDPEDDKRERPQRRVAAQPAPGRAPSLIDSFNYAFEGIIHVLRTQRNLRIHFVAAVLVFAAALAVGVTRLQLIALVLAIAFVLVAEMLNTAIEGVIDLSTTSFDPNAKLAKDIAAGAVLIASITAVAVGFLVFQNAVGQRGTHVLNRIRDAPADVTLVALVLVFFLVIATKAWTGRGTPLRGGLPSGHAALAFAAWVAVTYLVSGDHRFVVSSLALILAILVAQTRVESGIHSTLEVVYGGALGALVTLVLFQLVGVSALRLAIWDFDGTLAHRRGETGWSILLAETLDAEEPGHAHSADTFRPHLREGFPWHSPAVAHPELCEPDAWWASVRPVLGRAYEAAGYPPERSLELANAARRLYVDPSVGWELFPDTLPTLARLTQAGWTHAILSNHVPELRQIVTALGLDEHVELLSCSAETGYEKPHAQAYASVLDRLRPAEVWMIGDNIVADVLGAEELGIPAVLVRRPDSRAARYADSLAGVPAFLEERAAAA